MHKLLSGLIGSGTWLAMTITHVSRNEIAWMEHLPALLAGFLFGSLGLSLLLFVLFFQEQRDIRTQGAAIVREAGIRAVLFMVGILLIMAASYLLYLTDPR